MVNLIKMLLGDYCDTDSDMDSEKELDIQSACTMIRAAGEKLEVRVGLHPQGLLVTSILSDTGNTQTSQSQPNFCLGDTILHLSHH
ncbi:hypothetical protein BC936DRAFT_139083 [Jimgerdemannia flammicorona]|uniref:Uncharacterized protein n=1 Tax=Jimgerdemannia flammicorona TaxID=994334 RepID=A0A433BAP6_9FUNG|nr:hypothetical protein BC936DRAFT_139083 [Jimgerdemannia flammicorona]